MKTLRSPRKKPGQTRSPATVETILEAAAHLFSETAFDLVTTNAIAERAGVSVGTFYQYFPNKLALLESVKVRHFNGMWAAIGSACVEACNLPLAEGLRYFISAGIAHNIRQASLLRMFVTQLPTQLEADDPLFVAKATHERQLRRFLIAHKASIKVDLDRAIFMLPVLARGIFTAIVVECPEDLKNGAVVDQMTSVILRYLTCTVLACG